MYKKIFNPKTNKNISIHNNLGKQLLNKYIQKAGWLSDQTLRKQLSDDGFYRFGLEIETCMDACRDVNRNSRRPECGFAQRATPHACCGTPPDDGWNCDWNNDINDPDSQSWNWDSPHELVPTEDHSLECPEHQKMKEFIIDNRADYLWNGIKSNGYTNIGSFNSEGIYGYSNINTILNNLLKTFYTEDGEILVANRCSNYIPDRGWRSTAGEASSCAFHVHMSDPYIKGTSREGSLMLIEIATLWRGVEGIQEPSTFGSKSNTFPFLETYQPYDWTVQDVLCNPDINYSRDEPPWTSKKIPTMSEDDYEKALIGTLTQWQTKHPDWFRAVVAQNSDNELYDEDGDYNPDPSRYWNLNCGQSTESGKGWLDKNDGVHVEFRGHDDPFKVFENLGLTTKTEIMIYMKNYLRHLIQIFNAAKNRMKLLIHIYKSFSSPPSNYSKEDIVYLYISFLKSGVVNLEILRQKLFAFPNTNNALGGDFVENNLTQKEIKILKTYGGWTDTRDPKIIPANEGNSPAYILGKSGMSEAWIARKIPLFHKALEYTGTSKLYGKYGSKLHTKDLLRMFALPDPNTISSSFINNENGANLEDTTIENINKQLIIELLQRTATHKGLTSSAGKSQERKEWVNSMFSCLEEARITTVYRFIYMFSLENPNDIGYPFDESNERYGEKCGDRLDSETIQIIKNMLNGFGISSDLGTEQWY
jgi:hypothetical protein